ncbi:GGDEF family protein [Vibrio mediterranei AK1]|uniref:bifunctional diguanylate cyclase/phosphodiesterase n=1 Tax=Vibrio mediterranei TaxID=689 RepID=UPI0001542F1B|nr:EAL domain-containing protein [Vibrio mediterranei]EDL51402.1 GGDEF family protein [Vibrio mediterranei AK1]
MPGLLKISFKKALITPFILVFLCSIGTILWLQKEHYDDLALEISEKQLTSLSYNVIQSLDIYLERPMAVADALAHAIEYHQLYSANDALAIEDYLLSSFKSLHTEFSQIDLLGFGGELGEFLAIRNAKSIHTPNGYSLMVKDANTGEQLNIYQGENRQSQVIDTIKPYDPRLRPWYQPIKENPVAMWSKLYANADAEQEVTISALAPVFSSDGDIRTFVGVAAVDVQIDTFSLFLNELKHAHNAQVFIIDNQRQLIAQADDESILDANGQRLSMADSLHPALTFLDQTLDNTELTEPHLFAFPYRGDTHYVMVSHYQTNTNLSWYVVVSISNHALLGDIPMISKQTLIAGLILGVLGLLVGIVIINRLILPMSETAEAAKQISNGSWDYPLPKNNRIKEISLLVESFSAMRSHLQASFHTLREQLTRDSLTKLYSRQGFIETCNAMKSNSGCMMLLGINQFRDINDSLGHHQGDILLSVIAERLKAWVLLENGVLGRVAGDEFAIYLPDVKPQQQMCYQHRIRQIFSAPFVMQGEPLMLQVSIGIAPITGEDTTDTTLRNAGIAHSHAKFDCQRCCIYTPDMAESSKKKTRLLATLRHAIDNNKFEVHFQPIIELDNGQTLGAEALLRLRDDEGQFISPLDFIPIAEGSGLISSIGRIMAEKSLETVVKAIKQQQLPAHFQLHINVSVIELASASYVDELSGLLKRAGFPASQLTVEVTESRLADNDPITLGNLSKIRALGVNIAIDDFGTGYSSLAYLHKLPFNSLKVDKAFVDRLTPDNAEQSVVAAITKLSSSFGFTLVAEGIETPLQAKLVHDLGCHHAQGYLYGRPTPLEQWPQQAATTKMKNPVGIK